MHARAWEIVRVGEWRKIIRAAKMRRGDRDRKGERKRAGWKRGKTNNYKIRDRSRLTHLGIIEDEASTLPHNACIHPNSSASAHPSKLRKIIV